MAFSLSHPVDITLISLLLSDLETASRLLSTSGGSQNAFSLCNSYDTIVNLGIISLKEIVHCQC